MFARLMIVLSLPLLIRGIPTTELPLSSASNETSLCPCTANTSTTLTTSVQGSASSVSLLHGSYLCHMGLLRGFPARDDYKYSPGIGAHKLHTRAATWNDARKMCNEEGGHLAIINSLVEAHILMEIFTKSGLVKGAAYNDLAYVGVHDLYKEGEWVTILGESLFKTGYTAWSDKYGGQPDNGGGKQNCAVFLKDGGLDDVNCDVPFAFFCELPMTCIVN